MSVKLKDTIYDLINNSNFSEQLKTPRTIWGQSFDGSGNVSGTISSNVTKDKYRLTYDIYYQGTEIYANNLSAGEQISINVGKSYNAKKMAYIGYYQGADDSQSRLTLGLHSVDNSLVINTSGNVGIGTTNPSYKLDSVISNTSNFVVACFTNTSYHGGIAINSAEGCNPFIRFQAKGVTKAECGYSSSKDNFYIGTYNTDIGHININISSGNVGIGTINPAHPLQIYKSSTTNGDMIRLDSNSSWCGIVYRPSGGYVWSLNAGNPDTFNFWNNYIGGDAMRIKQTGNVWIRGNVTSGGFYNKNGDSAQTSSYMWGLYQWGNKIQMTRRNASTEAYESLLYEINIDTKDITFSNNVTVSGSCNVSTLKIGGETITFTT